jgi:hypothetical protein
MNNRRFRCATPPVIHNLAASAAILLSQNKNSTDILRINYLLLIKVFGFTAGLPEGKPANTFWRFAL